MSNLKECRECKYFGVFSYPEKDGSTSQTTVCRLHWSVLLQTHTKCVFWKPISPAQDEEEEKWSTLVETAHTLSQV